MQCVVCEGGDGGLCGGEVEQQCHKSVFHPYLSESRVGQPGGGVGWDCTKSRKNIFTSSTLRAPGKDKHKNRLNGFIVTTLCS